MIQRIEPDAARDMLYALAKNPGVETVKTENALNRVLAQDIIAEIPIPPFDRSPWDGYALRSADVISATRENPVILKITEELPAGTVPGVTLTPGFAAKILTGAPMPPGSDCTVKYEDTEFSAAEVKIFAPIAPGKDYVCAGDDVPQGTYIARRGELINPPLMGLITSVGLAEISVYIAPRAAIINSGTELVNPGAPLPPAKIYNSNVFLLTGYLCANGVDARGYGVVDDDPDAIAERIKDVLTLADVVLTTGGASVGDYDCSLRALEILGAKILFWKAKLKPGGAVIGAVKDGKLILALPGNPGGAIMFLLRCVMPYLRKLCGRADCFPKPVEVYLKAPFNKLSERARMLRGRLEIIGGKAYFAEEGPQGGGDISSFANADLLAEIPAGSAPLPAKTIVKAWRL